MYVHIPGFISYQCCSLVLLILCFIGAEGRVFEGRACMAMGSTVVYSRGAGGWHILGRTHRQLFDPSADPPALLRAGDQVPPVMAARSAHVKMMENEEGSYGGSNSRHGRVGTNMHVCRCVSLRVMM